MTETEWKLRKELAETKLALYGAQNANLQLKAQDAQGELVKLGEKWEAPKDDAPAA